MAACRVRLADKDIVRRASAAYSFQESGVDELREVVGRLGAAHAAERFVATAGQRCCASVTQERKRPMLCRLEIVSS
jgi:hypothetical protein